LSIDILKYEYSGQTSGTLAYMKISRNDISEKLIMWRDGALTRNDLFRWAVEVYFPGVTEFEDWEEGPENSVTNEVLSRLGMLDIDSYSEKDIPVFLEFLKTPAGKFEEGYRKFIEEVESPDF
jgi:hypothetical protein